MVRRARHGPSLNGPQWDGSLRRALGSPARRLLLRMQQEAHDEEADDDDAQFKACECVHDPARAGCVPRFRSPLEGGDAMTAVTIAPVSTGTPFGQVVAILGNDPGWQGALGFDQLERRIVFRA